MHPVSPMVVFVLHLKRVVTRFGILQGAFYKVPAYHAYLLSPMYLQDGPNGTRILYIPSVFLSYNGEALDEKTVLLRSVESINKSATKLLNLLGHKDVTRVSATLGTEQEFFLLDRGL
jgi:glutamine synthetase type III